MYNKKMVDFGIETGINVREDREGHRPLVGYLIVLPPMQVYT